MTTCDDEAPTPEQQFNTLKNELIAAAGSPGLTSFHNGKVHMTLEEWSRLVAIIAAGAVIRDVLNHARNTCEIVEYRVSGKHDTWDSYHEGRAAFADEIWKILDRVELASTETHTPRSRCVLRFCSTRSVASPIKTASARLGPAT